MNRRGFLGTLMAVCITPLLAKLGWAEPQTHSFGPEDIGPWLKRCGGCGDFFPDTVRTVSEGFVCDPGFEMAAYSHGNQVCFIREAKWTKGCYTITRVSSTKDCAG